MGVVKTLEKELQSWWVVEKPSLGPELWGWKPGLSPPPPDMLRPQSPSLHFLRRIHLKQPPFPTC